MGIGVCLKIGNESLCLVLADHDLLAMFDLFSHADIRKDAMGA